MNASGSSKRLITSLLLAGILATGAAAVCNFGITTAISVAQQWLTSRMSEYVIATRSGEVLIARYDGSSAGTSYRTLDGLPVSDQTATQSAAGAELPRHGSFNAGGSLWAGRIIGFRDSRLPVGYWYLVSHGPDEVGYFAGYDSRTKRLIGYLGLSGFRPEAPPPDDQFVVQGPSAGTRAAPGAQPFVDGYDLASLFLVSNGKLLLVDLGQRSIRKISLPVEVYGCADLYELSKTDTDTSLVLKQSVAVRAADKILVLDSKGGLLRTIPMPEAIRGRDYRLYQWLDGTSVLLASKDSKTEVYWLDTEGSVTRYESVPLASPDWTTEFRRAIWTAAVALPLPAPLAINDMVVVPQSLINNGYASDFNSALHATMSEAWPALLLVCLLAVALVPLVLKRQRLFAARGTVGWVLLVLLMGPAGLLGYWLHRHWPVLRRCESCGRTIPTDSLECALCGVEMPPPSPRGIEVMA